MNKGWGITVSGFTAYWQIPNVPPDNDYVGSRIRGILGHALFSQVCPYAKACCQQCAMASYCDYPRFFKPQDPAVLPAYILHDWQVGKQTISVTVLLLGSAAQAAENWIRGLFLQLPFLDWWGKGGMQLQRVTDWHSGSRLFARGRFTAKAHLSKAEHWPSIAADADVHFITPLVSKHQQDDPLLPALKTRIQRLRNQFGDTESFDRAGNYWHCQVKTNQSVSLVLGENQRKLVGSYYHLKLTQVNEEGAALLGAGLWLHAGGQTGVGAGRYNLVIK